MLAELFQTLTSQAARLGRDQGVTLRGGARIAVRIRADGVHIVTFSRINKPLSDREIATFCQHCQIPEVARKTVGATDLNPKEKRFWVAYRWEEEAHAAPR